jgi:two-component system response regulator YesN
MFKLMVVDNEFIERKALCILIDKNFKNLLQIIGQAQNGQDAVDMALELKPDIILMDIKMPVLDGLEASELIKETLLNVEIIILTAFDYFEYAKKAIDLQVNQYLLKPISEDKLIATLSKTIKKIETRQQVKQQNLRNLESIETLKPLIHKKIIKELINETLVLDEYIDYVKLLNIQCSQFMSFIIENQDSQPFSKYIIESCYHKLKFVFGKVIFENYFNSMIFLIYIKPNNMGNFENVIENVIHDIRECIKNNMTTDIYVGVSKLHDIHNDIYCVYEEATQSLNNQKYITQKINTSKLSSYPVAAERNLYDHIIHGDFENALIELEYILSYLTQVKDQKFCILSMQQFCFMLYRNLLIQYGDLSIQADINKMLEALNCCDNMDKIKDYMHNYLKRVITKIESFSNSKSEQIILDAKKYIEEHYKSSAFSLNEVADALMISPYYLSRLFKKYTNVNFKDYLITVRMEAAKKLLIDSKNTIKEICYAIGYEDPNYFSRAFKKYEGIPATLYARKVSK